MCIRDRAQTLHLAFLAPNLHFWPHQQPLQPTPKAGPVSLCTFALLDSSTWPSGLHPGSLGGPAPSEGTSQGENSLRCWQLARVRPTTALSGWKAPGPGLCLEQGRCQGPGSFLPPSQDVAPGASVSPAATWGGRGSNTHPHGNDQNRIWRGHGKGGRFTFPASPAHPPGVR